MTARGAAGAAQRHHTAGDLDSGTAPTLPRHVCPRRVASAPPTPPTNHQHHHPTLPPLFVRSRAIGDRRNFSLPRHLAACVSLAGRATRPDRVHRLAVGQLHRQGHRGAAHGEQVPEGRSRSVLQRGCCLSPLAPAHAYPVHPPRRRKFGRRCAVSLWSGSSSSSLCSACSSAAEAEGGRRRRRPQRRRRQVGKHSAAGNLASPSWTRPPPSTRACTRSGVWSALAGETRSLAWERHCTT